MRQQHSLVLGSNHATSVLTGMALLQNPPNFVNEEGVFPQCIVSPEQPYSQTLIWRFFNVTESSTPASAG